MGSKSYRPKLCSCGSGKPAEPQIYNGQIIGFACVVCENVKMAVFCPEVLSDPDFFFINTELQPKAKD